jgi:hypothetical protein
MSKQSGAEMLVEHIKDCTDAQAVVVVDGSADDIITRMVADGWVLRDRIDRIAGKRIRFMEPPGDKS